MPATRTISPVDRPQTRAPTHRIAWQGWSIVVPDSWNPVKVDGNDDDGSLLLADLYAPRLGLRWTTLRPRDDAVAWVERAMQHEVGKLAAAEAVDVCPSPAGEWSIAKLYRDPAPPGRDVFVGHSRQSGRVVQMVRHAERRSDKFADTLLPTLTDTPTDAVRNVAMFDLRLMLPAGTWVPWYRFNAGDLAVGLVVPGASRRVVTTVRQVGPASLALARQPLADWLKPRLSAGKLYGPVRDIEPVTLLASDGRTLGGLQGILLRRRRLWWAWMVDRRQSMLALHDSARDRLVLGQSADEAALRQVLTTVGCTTPEAAR